MVKDNNLKLFDTAPSVNQKTKKNKRPKAKVNYKADPKAAELWTDCLEIIKDNIDKSVYRTWFEPIKPLAWSNNQLTILVPSQFFFEWIEEHYYDLLQKTLKQCINPDAKIQYEVIVEENQGTLKKSSIKVPGLRYPPSTSQAALPFAKPPSVTKQFPNFLNARYSFDNFIIGESNQFAHSAAMAVSNEPGGTKFNPLVIYGDTGLGKTHLIQAIGNNIITTTDARAFYTNSERFTMEFVNAIQNNKVNEFINFYRSIDILIVDDIQFFAGKEKTQDNFFHTFNALHQAGKQLVLSSDRPPKDLKGVDDRLISRFQWGLTVDIQHPDLEMRMAILQKKSLDEGIELPPDIVEFIAQNVKSSIRELEGTLISLIAKYTLDRREFSIDLAREVVEGIAFDRSKPVTVDEIKSAVSDYFDIEVALLESKSRKHEVTLARQVAIYIAKQLTENSLKKIGSYFSGRDHSTVLHSCSTVENYLITDRNIKKAYESLMTKLKRQP